MEFLNLGLLPYFLPLVAIPIVLHLLTLHRLKTVELSTFRFLFDSYVQQRRKMKFLEALLAILRTLFLLFLVLSIARPVVSHWDSLFGSSDTGRDIIMMFDTSASMGATTDGTSALGQSKRTALEIVDRLGADDRVTILQVRAKPKEICSRFSSDAEAIQGEIESLEVSPSRANLFAAFSYIFGPDSAKLKRPRIYLFSDLQTDGWGEFEDGQSSGLIPKETELIVVNVGSATEIPNRAVVGGAPEDQHAIVGLPIILRPQVANFSQTESQNVTVSLFFDEKVVTKKNLTLKPGETGEAEIIFTPKKSGMLRGRYEIASDRFADDDTFLFSLHVVPQVEVLLVNGAPAAEPLENEGLYLRTAMTATEFSAETSEEVVDPTLAETKTFARSLNVQEIPEASLNAEILHEIDVVILANCGGLKAPAQYNLLCDFVSRGGGLIILPGEKVKPDVYNKQFFPALQRPHEQLLSVQLGPIEGNPDKIEEHEHFAAIDFAHPIFSVFSGSDEPYLTKVKVYRRFPIQFPEEPGNSWPVAEFSNSAPAFVESTFGEGRVLLSAFPFNTKWANLPLKPEFVPLVLRMVGHVKRPADVLGPSVVPADAPAEFVVSQNWAPASAKVTDIDGRVAPIVFERSNSRLMGAFDQTIAKGFYEVKVQGGSTEQPKQKTLSFAVNVASGESNFEMKTEPQISSLLPNAKLTFVDASAEAQQLYGNVGNQKEIWRPLILLMFVIIGVEFLLSTMGGQTAESGEQLTTSQRIREITMGTWVGRMTGAGLKEEAEKQSVSGE